MRELVDMATVGRVQQELRGRNEVQAQDVRQRNHRGKGLRQRTRPGGTDLQLEGG